MIHGIFLALFRLAKSFSSLATLGIMLSWQVTVVLAGQVTLSWDTNTESNLGGYRVYYGQASRNYSATTDVGKQTQYTVTNLEEGKIFYFAVTAYDNTRTIESGFSNEVSTIVQVTPKVYTVLPCRVVDTRQTGTGNVPFSGQILPGEMIHFHVTSNLIAGQGGATDCGVPIGATGAFLNLTAVSPTGTGYLTLYPYGETQPTASTLNFQAGRIATASGVLAPLCDPAGGSGCAYDLTLTNGPEASVHLLIDVSGYLAVPEVAP